MPIEKKYPFKSISKLLKRKFPVSRNRLTIEYIMRKDNISIKNVRQLKKMFTFGMIKLNVIPLNEGDHSLTTPTKTEIENFVKELEIMDIPVSIRKSLGSDIDGACGQLSGKKYKKQ